MRTSAMMTVAVAMILGAVTIAAPAQSSDSKPTNTTQAAGGTGTAASPQAPTPHYFAEDHLASINGIRVGMTAQQVLDILGRMPDARKDEKGEIIVSWKVQDGNLLQVRFRNGNYVSYIGLQYKAPRPTNDLALQPLGERTANDARTRVEMGPSLTGGPVDITVGSIPFNSDRAPVLSSGAAPSDLTGRDPRIHPEYKVAETVDKERVIWNRSELAPGGAFHLEIGFISTDKKKMGELFDGRVEFKYVTVEKADLKKFAALLPK